jgi:hypothetical protein
MQVPDLVGEQVLAAAHCGIVCAEGIDGSLGTAATRLRGYLTCWLSSCLVTSATAAAAAAAAVCRCCLQVGLTVLQYLAWVVQASIAASTAAAAAAPGPGSSSAANGGAAAAGPAEGVLAKKLLELVKAVGAQEAAGEVLPIVKNTNQWAKKMAALLRIPGQKGPQQLIIAALVAKNASCC